MRSTSFSWRRVDDSYNSYSKAPTGKGKTKLHAGNKCWDSRALPEIDVDRANPGNHHDCRAQKFRCKKLYVLMCHLNQILAVFSCRLVQKPKAGRAAEWKYGSSRACGTCCFYRSEDSASTSASVPLRAGMLLRKHILREGFHELSALPLVHVVHSLDNWGFLRK